MVEIDNDHQTIQENNKNNIDEPLMHLLELILPHKFGYSNVFDVVMCFCYHVPRQLFAVSGGDNKIENPSNGPAAMAIVYCDILLMKCQLLADRISTIFTNFCVFLKEREVGEPPPPNI